MTRLLKLKHYRQKPGYCGPASLKIAFSYFGVEATENEIGKIAKCTSEEGTSHKMMVATAKYFGFKTNDKIYAKLNEVEKIITKQKLPVIVGWFSETEDHYSVVVGMDKKYIYLDDPEKNKAPHKITRDFFEHVWFDFEGKKNEKIVWGWMMTIRS